MVIKNTLLLVVDVQNGFVTDGTRHVLPPINKLIRHWHDNNGAVAFSRFINPENSLYEKLRGWCACRSEPEVALHPDLERNEDDIVFEKPTYSAWGSDVDKFCKSRDIDKVVVCGIDTNECVLATAIGIFDAGFVPVVAKDCCASKGQEFHESALMLLEVLLGQEQVVESAAIKGDSA